MRIVLNIGEILFDIADKSHAECAAAFPDPEERYKYEAGTEKRDGVLRCLETALAALDVALEDFTAGPHEYLGTNEPGIQDGDAVEFDFAPSTRRPASQAKAVADLMHSHLVSSVLSLFDAGLGRTDAAQGWAASAQADLALIVEHLCSKARPVRSAPYSR